MINALAEVKKACAIANYLAGELPKEKSDAIVQACDEIISGKFHDAFICDPIQGGAGTSANMNANEVIANRAGELLGSRLGSYDTIHPNDHVNMGQSTNDVFPTAGKIATIRKIRRSLVPLRKLQKALEDKAVEFDSVITVGRTQMQDAVPIRLGQSFGAFAAALKRTLDRLANVQELLYVSNMGGTAIGTGINAAAEYMNKIGGILAEVTGLPIVIADNLVDATQNLDIFVNVSATVKACAVAMSKIANDLRLLSSGPKAGLAEISLPPRQNGSSIMPGKVNPVIPEVVTQVCFNVIGNDVTITMAAEAGQMELNAFEPVLFFNLFESIDQIGRVAETFRVNCIEDIKPNLKQIKFWMNNSLVLVTSLCPYIGYTRAAELAEISLETGIPIRQVVLEHTDLGPEKLDEIMEPLHMTIPPNRK